MPPDGKIKVVGRRQQSQNAEDFFWRAHRLQQSVELLNPHPRPRGFVHKAPTWEAYARWRQAQKNPRLW